MPIRETLESFGKTLYQIAKSDRDITLGVGGFTGEGKSVYILQQIPHYNRWAKVPFSYEHNMTWERSELFKWIDGDEKGKGKKPEYSPIIADEFVSMFFKRNWYESEQIGAIEKLNKCRDRHLFIAGAIPNFWDLDSALRSRIRFYAYIPRGRGKVWIFEQEDNPFTTDAWNVRENMKIFRKGRNPYKCPNFVCEILFNDLSPKQRKEYYRIRNIKRVNTELQNKQKKDVVKYPKLTGQRNIMIRKFKEFNSKVTSKEIAKWLDLNPTHISDIVNNRYGNSGEFG